MWRAWPAAEIQRDLDLVRALGMNCGRFFLRRQDFEPAPRRYDRAPFRRLAIFLQWCRERAILAHPSLFVGWMSGGIFWPAWKAGRNLFSDAFVRRRALAFAERASRAGARFPDTVLAFDQGNELCCLPECLEASPADVAGWCEEVSRAVRRGFPRGAGGFGQRAKAKSLPTPAGASARSGAAIAVRCTRIPSAPGTRFRSMG